MTVEANVAVEAQMRRLLEYMNEISSMEDDIQVRLIRERIEEIKVTAEIGWV